MSGNDLISAFMDEMIEANIKHLSSIMHKCEENKELIATTIDNEYIASAAQALKEVGTDPRDRAVLVMYRFLLNHLHDGIARHAKAINSAPTWEHFKNIMLTIEAAAEETRSQKRAARAEQPVN